MKRHFLLFTAFVVLILSSCKQEQVNSIRLRWVKAHPSETWADVQTGLLWSLSYMGAALDSSKLMDILVREDSSHFVLHLDQAGFTAQALRSLSVICDSLRASDEYEKTGCADLGRFLLLSEHTSAHYYSIADVAPTLQEYYKRHDLSKAKTFNLYTSGVAEHHRVIRFNVGADYSSIAWLALEGSGDIDSGTFHIEAYEALDVMPNGQLRFAVYDADGKLLPASPVHLGKAGKPSKCMWCHEIVVNPLFVVSPEPKQGISTHEFGLWVDSSQHIIDRYRKSLHSLIDFSKRQDHTYGELLYISFMEPSSYRLANEWQLSLLEVEMKMHAFRTHPYKEFPFLGDCYYRYYADSLSPYRSREVPVSVREFYGKEPDYFSKDKK